MFGLFIPGTPSYVTAEGAKAQPTAEPGILGFVNKLLGMSRPAYVGQAQAQPSNGFLFGKTPQYVSVPAVADERNDAKELPPPVVELVQDPLSVQVPATITIVIKTQ